MRNFAIRLVPIVIISIALCFALPVGAQWMTVRHLDNLIARGSDGEVAAVAYVQGVMDGMLGMDSLYQKEKRLPPEFCRIFEKMKNGDAVVHPAYRTKDIVAAWKREGHSMDTLAVDMVLAFMTAQFGCKR